MLLSLQKIGIATKRTEINKITKKKTGVQISVVKTGHMNIDIKKRLGNEE